MGEAQLTQILKAGFNSTPTAAGGTAEDPPPASRTPPLEGTIAKKAGERVGHP
jgi:hypothetical protein